MQWITVILVATTVASYAQQDANPAMSYISADCNEPRLIVPMGITRDSVSILFAKDGLTPLKASTETTDAYAYPSQRVTCTVSYRQGKVCAVFVFLEQASEMEAVAMAAAVNKGIEEGHGEPDPKTRYYTRLCNTGSYALKASASKLTAGWYLCLALLKTR